MTDTARVAVVGAHGFLGAAMVRGLREAGVATWGFTRERPCLSGGRPAGPLVAADTVVWAASSVNPALAETDPAGVQRDLDAFRRVLQALDGPRVVLLSSGGTVYDPARPPPYDETAPTAPAGAYGRAKLAQEELLREAAPRSTVLRLSNAYGAGQPVGRGQGVIAHWLAAAAAGQALQLFGDPTTRRDYVHVEDVVAALLAVVGHPGPLPAVLNIGAGVPTRLDELARILLQVAGRPDLPVEVTPARRFDVAHTWLDIRRAERVLGWRPRLDLRAGLHRTWSQLALPGVAR